MESQRAPPVPRGMGRGPDRQPQPLGQGKHLGRRFWQARAVESFLRGTTSYADQMFLLKRGLLEVTAWRSQGVGCPVPPSPLHCLPVPRPRKLGRSSCICFKMPVQIALVCDLSLQLGVPVGCFPDDGRTRGGGRGAYVSVESPSRAF